jgi:hypothetical protein
MGNSGPSEVDRLLNPWDDSEASRLTKEWLESGEDTLPQVIKDDIKNRRRIEPIPSRQLLERYRQSALELHFHLFSLSDATAPDYCVTVVNGIDNITDPVLGGYESEGESPVLVDIDEMIKPPEVVARVGIGVVGLQLLDDCYRRIGNPVKSPAPFLGSNSLVPSAGIPANWELITAAGLASRIYQNQLPDQMIEGGSQIVEAVTNNNAERQGWLSEFRNKIGLFRIRVILFNDAALLFVPLDLGGYSVEMFFGPDDFVANTVERMAH